MAETQLNWKPANEREWGSSEADSQPNDNNVRE